MREAEIMRLGGDHRGIVDFVEMFSSETHWWALLLKTLTLYSYLRLLFKTLT